MRKDVGKGLETGNKNENRKRKKIGRGRPLFYFACFSMLLIPSHSSARDMQLRKSPFVQWRRRC